MPMREALPLALSGIFDQGNVSQAVVVCVPVTAHRALGGRRVTALHHESLCCTLTQASLS